jgi:hypothetical protein
MKANLKGLGGIKGLALRHGEKIVIAIIGLLALWFVYSSLNLPSLDETKQAPALASLVSTTKTSITNSTWPAAGSEEAKDIREYNPIAKHAAVAVDPDKYSFRGIDPPVLAATLLRGDPVLLGAVDLKVYGNSAILAYRDEKTQEEQERRRRLKEEEKERERERLAAQQQAEGAEEPGGRRAGRGGPEEIDAAVFDPDHPERRLIEGTGTPVGVPLQGGERLERVAWATIVAKVPIREQLELFQDAFRNARGYDAARDFPQYVGFQVQRSEVVAGKPAEWKAIYVYDGQRKNFPNAPAGKFVNVTTITKLKELEGREWAGPAIEPVDARWTDMMLTMPLPPLVGRNFGADATHPDIPLAENAPPPEVEVVPVDDPTQQQPTDGQDDSDFNAGVAGQQRPAGSEFAMQPRAAGPGFGFGPEGRGPSLGFRRGYGGPEGGEFGPGMRMGPEGGGSSFAGGISSGQRSVLPREVDDLLLRFFDYTVEPGKEYQYRVRVFLADPNSSFALESGVLDGAVVDRRIKEKKEAESKKAQVPWYRAAEWSEPSPVVGIPSGGSVHLAEAELPSGKTANDEPAVKLIAETFDIEPDGSAIHVAQETEFRRGAVINLKGKMKYTGENDRWIDTKDSYALNTGLTILDIDGGEQLVRDSVAPSRVLLMDGSGQLFVREQQDDTTNVQRLRFVFSDKPRKSGEIPGGGFGPEGGGPGRERRRGLQ